MQSSDKPKLTADEIENQVCLVRLQKMHASLFEKAPKDYLIQNREGFEDFLSIENLIPSQRLLRYQVYFEALRTAMAITLKIFKLYDHKVELPVDVNENLLVDIVAHPTYFKVTPAKVVSEENKVFAEDQINFFEYVVDTKTLMGMINRSLDIDFIAGLAATANIFYAEITNKSIAVKSLLNDLRLKTIPDALFIDTFGEDALMIGISAARFEHFKTCSQQDKDASRKKQKVINFLTNVASISQSHIGIVKMIHTSDPTIEKLCQLRVSQESYKGEFYTLMESTIVYSGYEKAWLDKDALCETVWDYFGHANDPEWLSMKIAEFNEITRDANAFIAKIDDEKKIQDDGRRQANIFQIIVDGMRNQVLDKDRIDKSKLHMLAQELSVVMAAPVMATVTTPPRQDLMVSRLEGGVPLPADVINTINEEIRISTETVAYQANVQHTQILIATLRKLDEQMYLQVQDLKKCGIPPRKKFQKLINEIATLSSQISNIYVEAKEYSAQAAEAVADKRSLAEYCLEKMNNNSTAISEELKYVKERVAQLQREEKNKDKRDQKTELKKQKEAAEAKIRALKEAEEDRMLAEEARLEAEEEERLAKMEEDRLAAIEKAKQDKLENKRLAKAKFEQEKLEQAARELAKLEELKQEQERQELLKQEQATQERLNQKRIKQEQVRQNRIKQEELRLARVRQREQARKRLAEIELRKKYTVKTSLSTSEVNSLSPSSQTQLKSEELPSADLINVSKSLPPVERTRSDETEAIRLELAQIRLSETKQESLADSNSVDSGITPTPSPSPTITTTELHRSHSAPAPEHAQLSINFALGAFDRPLYHSQSYYSLFSSSPPASSPTATVPQQSIPLQSVQTYGLFGNGNVNGNGAASPIDQILSQSFPWLRQRMQNQ
ncbi:MAG: hypothetical protein V4501_07700 [Pseudomonadota bacterium]